ncbi:MAG: hypothetical protein RJA22_2400 [Verrucomicrobiota bacterium]
MKIFPFVMMVTLTVIDSNPLFAQEGKSTLGIARVATSPRLSNQVAASSSDPLSQILGSFDSQLEVAISATRKFHVVAIKDLNEVLNKQDLAASGNFDPRNSNQSGQLDPAKYIVLVEIDHFHDSFRELATAQPKSAAGVPTAQSRAAGASGQDPALVAPAPVAVERTVRLHAVAKIYDTSSGRLFEAANISSQRSEITRSSHDSSLANATVTGDPLLRELTKDSAQAIALRVADTVFPIKVLSKREKLLTLNRGEGAGVVAGQLWDVYAAGKELIDEDTHEPLGPEEMLVGKARVITVHPKTSIAELLEDRGVERGSILRLPLPEPPPVDLGQATSAMAKRTVLFGFLKWGDHVYAEGVGPPGTGELAKTMRAAAYKAMVNANAIALEDPSYVVSKRNFLILQRYKVEAKGFGRRNRDNQPRAGAFFTPPRDPAREAALLAEDLTRREQQRLAAEAAAAEAKAKAREEELRIKQAAVTAMAEAKARREIEIEAAAAKAQAEAKVREEEMKVKQAALAAAMAAKAEEEEARLQREKERKAIEAAMAAAEAQLREEERLAMEAAKAAETEARLRREQERKAALEAEARRRDQERQIATAARVAEAEAKARLEQERRAADALKAQQEELRRERELAEREAAKARAAAGQAAASRPLTQSQIQRLANLYKAYTNSLLSYGRYDRERAKIINE